MEGSRGANGSRHLRAVGAAALAERLAMTPSELPARPVETALGLLIAGGRVDERAGRLVPVSEDQRRAV